jgi:uncharacterized coiled-coil protein SlyX
MRQAGDRRLTTFVDQTLEHLYEQLAESHKIWEQANEQLKYDRFDSISSVQAEKKAWSRVVRIQRSILRFEQATKDNK